MKINLTSIDGGGSTDDPSFTGTMRIDDQLPLWVVPGSDDNSGNTLTVDVAKGGGLVDFVAGARHHDRNTYKYTGRRGASRIRLHDNRIDMFIHDGTPSLDANVPFQRRFLLNNNGLTITGNLNVSGAKNFCIERPTDSTKTLTHSCLEGPEVAVYYRGTGKLSGGVTTIELPDYFEALVKADNRTVQITSIVDEFDIERTAQLGATIVKDGKFRVYRIGGVNDEQRFNWEVKGERKGVNIDVE